MQFGWRGAKGWGQFEAGDSILWNGVSEYFGDAVEPVAGEALEVVKFADKCPGSELRHLGVTLSFPA